MGFKQNKSFNSPVANIKYHTADTNFVKILALFHRIFIEQNLF